jgi:hypothetical protein
MWMITLKVPEDPIRTKMVPFTEVNDLLFQLRRHPQSRILRTWPAINQTLLPILLVPGLPVVESLPGYLEISACLGYVTSLFIIPQNS